MCKYNKYIFNRFDENVQSLCIGLRGKKWWYPLFAFGLDSACQNEWPIFKVVSRETYQYCEFRRAVFQSYCDRYGMATKKSVTCGAPVQGRVLPAVGLSSKIEELVREDCLYSTKMCEMLQAYTDHV